jgi:hypothetical protein
MAGRDVNRSNLDQVTADAVIAVRDAFRQVRTVKAFLDQVPANAEGGDPLTKPMAQVADSPPDFVPGKFGYTEDEAYLIRLVFDQLNALDVQPILDTGRKLTGLS